MKTKYNSFLKIFILSLLFISCSNDNETINTPEKKVLIKKITQTTYYSNQSETSILNFTYENDLLKKVSQGNYLSELTYNNDKITKIDYSNNGVLNNTIVLNYNGDLLINTLSGNNQEEKTQFTYQNNILSKIESGYLSGNNFIIQGSNDLIINSAGNLAQSITTSSVFPPTTISKLLYTYDNKNHPLKNMNKYFRLIFAVEGFDGLSTNNKLTKESFYPITSTTSVNYYFTYIYNNDNYPTEINRFASSDNFLISKTVIEYQ